MSAHKRMMRNVRGEWRRKYHTYKDKIDNNAPLLGQAEKELEEKSKEVLDFADGDLHEYFTEAEVEEIMEYAEEGSSGFGPFSF